MRKNYDLLGFSPDALDESYPSIVTIACRKDNKDGVFSYCDNPNGGRWDKIDALTVTTLYDVPFTPEMKIALANFDPEEQALFAWSRNELVAYPNRGPGHAAFFRQVLADPRAATLQPWKVEQISSYAQRDWKFTLTGYEAFPDLEGYPLPVSAVGTLNGETVAIKHHSDRGPFTLGTGDKFKVDQCLFSIIDLTNEQKAKLAGFDHTTQSLFAWSTDNIVTYPASGPESIEARRAILDDPRSETMHRNVRQDMILNLEADIEVYGVAPYQDSFPAPPDNRPQACFDPSRLVIQETNETGKFVDLKGARLVEALLDYEWSEVFQQDDGILYAFVQMLNKIDPEVITDMLTRPRDFRASRFLQGLGPEAAVDVLENLAPFQQAKILENEGVSFLNDDHDNHYKSPACQMAIARLIVMIYDFSSADKFSVLNNSQTVAIFRAADKMPDIIGVVMSMDEKDRNEFLVNRYNAHNLLGDKQEAFKNDFRCGETMMRHISKLGPGECNELVIRTLEDNGLAEVLMKAKHGSGGALGFY